jgi:hypothetical protein
MATARHTLAFHPNEFRAVHTIPLVLEKLVATVVTMSDSIAALERRVTLANEDIAKKIKVVFLLSAT